MQKQLKIEVWVCNNHRIDTNILCVDTSSPIKFGCGGFELEILRNYIMIKLMMRSVLLILTIVATVSVNAEPRTVNQAISNMRAYTTGTYFVTLASSAIVGGSPCHRTYAVNNSDAGAKTVVASLLTAYALGQNVQIEIPTAAGCTGFGTGIQSVIISPG